MACGIVPEVLNQNNYTPWSLRLKTYLIAKDLWDVVQTDPPEVGCPSDEQKVWEKRSAEAMHAIQLSCGDDILSFISGTTSPKSAWNILQDKFEIARKNFGGNESSEGEDAGGRQRNMIKLTPLRSMVRGTRLKLKPTTDGNGSSEGGRQLELKSPTDGHESDGDDSYLEPLFKDVGLGDWNAAKAFLAQYPEAIRKVYSATGGTIIHKAIEARQVDVVKELLQLVKEEDLEITDVDGNTPLIYAIEEGSFEIVEIMIKKNKKIVTMRDEDNLTPVLVAHSLEFHEIARKLYALTPVEELTGGPNEGRDGAELISGCFYTQDFDIALDLIRRNPILALTTDYFDHSPLNALADVRSAFLCGVRLNLWQQWIYKLIHVEPTPAQTSTPITNDLCLNVENPQDEQGDQPGLIHSAVGLFRGLAKNLLKLLGVNRIHDMKSFHVRTLEVLRFMSETTHKTAWTPRQSTYVQTAIFRAVDRGQFEFIYHLFKDNPSILPAIRDGNGKPVLSYAVECRQAKIYNLLYGIMKESGRTSLLNYADSLNNSILNSAANLSTNLNHIQGAPLQMQSELQWFKEVESIVPVSILELINNTDNMTARELFTKNHKELVKEGEKSMKGTATSCTVVGALIVTMMFAAAFTVPGGINQDTGYPTFLGKKLFMVFIMSNSISLFFSTTSVMIFLGMLTSRYSEEDFLISLPTKMILGLFTLFFSIAAMMIAFSSTLILMLDKQSWIVFPVIFLATLPIASFVWMQFPLLLDTCISTYGAGKFDKK